MRRGLLSVLYLCACVLAVAFGSFVTWSAEVKANSFNGDKGDTLPQTKEIEVTVKGTKEVQTGTLFKSAEGYYMYVLPDFVASGEEPGVDIIFSKLDDTFTIRIEKLSPLTDLPLVKRNIKRELDLLGTSINLKKDSITDPFFKEADLFAQASDGNTTKKILLINIDNTMFRFTVTLPQTEDEEELAPRMWAMLKTIGIS